MSRTGTAEGYPANWGAISLAIRQRAEGRCECTGQCGLHRGRRCCEENGTLAIYARGKVMLTVAHLETPVLLPLGLHVTGATEGDEVVEIVGFLVPIAAELLECNDVVHGRALAEFRRGPAAGSARFLIALPGGAPRGTPRRPVVGLSPAAPVWVQLSSWCESSEPFQAARVSAESPSRPFVARRGSVGLMTPFTSQEDLGCTPAAIRPVEGVPTQKLVATGRRASALSFGGLAYCEREGGLADNTYGRAWTTPRRAPEARTFPPESRPPLNPAQTFVPAGDPRVLGADRVDPAAPETVRRLWAEAWSWHIAGLYHIGHIPADCRDINLLACCNRCHLRMDVPQHQATARATRRRKLNNRELFEPDLPAKKG